MYICERKYVFYLMIVNNKMKLVLHATKLKQSRPTSKHIKSFYPKIRQKTKSIHPYHIHIIKQNY